MRAVLIDLAAALAVFAFVVGVPLFFSGLAP